MTEAKKCQFDDNLCDNLNKYKVKKDPIKLSDLVNDVGPLFGADVELLEYELIQLRSTRLIDLNGFICTKHRSILGEGYRPSALCSYYKHPPNSNALGINVSWYLYQYVKSLDPKFVLGSLICKSCSTKLYSMMRQESDETNSDVDMDPDCVPSVPIIDENERQKRRKKLDALSEILETDRIRYQIASNIQDMSDTSLKYFQRKYQEMQNSLMNKFCSFVAPGQEKEFMNFLNKKEEIAIETDTVIEHLLEAFKTCMTRKARQGVLMLVPKTLSKSKICDLFGCSMYEIKTARTTLKLYGACGEEPKKERIYSRLSFHKARHFIDFLMTTGMLQEVAFGTTKLKFESGNKITISGTILNGIKENAVKQYIVHCAEINYERLGRSTLLNILDKMNPHIRKKLAGVDSFVVEGIEAFEVTNMLFCKRNCCE